MGHSRGFVVVGGDGVDVGAEGVADKCCQPHSWPRSFPEELCSANLENLPCLRFLAIRDMTNPVLKASIRMRAIPGIALL